MLPVEQMASMAMGGLNGSCSADSGRDPALYYLSYIARHLSSYAVELLMFTQFIDVW